MTSHPFQYGEQVWTYYDQQWWPAKVVDPSLIGFENDGSLYVQYYSAEAEVCHYPYDAATVVPFELSSEKAITDQPDLVDAIQRAKADPSVLQQQQPHSAYQAPSRKPKQQQQQATRRGRPAKEDQSQHAQPSNSAAAATMADYSTEINDTDLSNMKVDIQQYVAAEDVGALRRILLKLARVKPSFRQLQSTKIGVEVGKILQASSRLSQLQPIVSCILRLWMQELPEATKEALRRYAQRATGAGLSVLFGDDQGQGQGDENNNNDANDNKSNNNSASRKQQKHVSDADDKIPAGLTDFGVKLARRFIGYDSDDQATSANLTRFCTEVETQMRLVDERLKLLTEISKPAHTQLRGKLLSGEVSLAKFLTMTKDELMTDDERKMLQEDADALAFRAEEGKLVKIGNPLFECPECGARNSCQTEIQIRSADEPATVFIDCLDCGHNWREG